VRGGDHLLLSKAPRALNVADCLLRQLSFPAASTLLRRFLTQHARRRSSVPNTFASAVQKEMYPSPPETAFSAVVAMVWTCFLTISLFLLDSILPVGEVRTPCTCFLPHSCPFLNPPLLDASAPSFDDRIQRWLWQYHARSVQCFAAVALASCNLAHPAYRRVPFLHLKRHAIRSVVPPLFVIRNLPSLLRYRMSASGAVASVAFPPCPTHFLTAHTRSRG
jgi:hypothetical protein